MNTISKIVIAIVVIAIVVGGVAAGIYLSSPSSKASPTPTPTPTPTATASSSPSSSPSASPTHTSTPTSTPTSSPSSSPTASPTPTATIAPSTQLNGAGGTLVQPLMADWQIAYHQSQSKVQVNYNAIGSGAGITAFQGQTVDFGESDMPLQASDIAALPSGTTALTIPISASAIVPAYNLQLLNGSQCQNGLNFTGAVLANIFLGTVTKWNDASIQALQSPTTAAQLPATTITVIHRSDSSGTMYAFTDYLSQASTAWANGPGKNKAPNWPVGLGYKGNGGVAQGIQTNAGSLGPLEIAYALQNPSQISYGAVANSAGNYILANVSNMQASLAAGATSLPAGNASWSSVSIIDNIYDDKTAGIYPIVTLTYAIVYQSQTSYNQGAALVSFLTWAINQGQDYSTKEGYATLPSNIVTIDTATIKLITYQGTQIPVLS
jgi:phosphate transport system substrate-binding protein